MSRFEEYRQGIVNNVRRSLRIFDQEAVENPNVDPKVKRQADFAFRVALICSTLLLVIYVAFLITVGVLAGGDDDFSRLAFAAAPQWMTTLLYITLAFALIKSLIGTIGILRSSKVIATGLLISSGMVIFAMLTLLVAVLLRGGASDIIASEIDATTLADEVIQNIVKFGISDLDSWKQFQSDNVCCGLNLKAMYFKELFEPGNITVDDFISGNDCVFNNRVELILLEEPVFSEDVNFIRVDSDVALENYFCEDLIITRLRGLGNSTIPVVALPIFFEVVVMFYISILMSRYTLAEGGMKTRHRKVTAPAPKLEPTILKKAGWEGSKVRF